MAIRPWALLLASGALVAPSVVHPQQIAPLVYELETSGPGARQDVRVTNTGSSPIAFEITAARRDYDRGGEPRDTPEPDSLAILPDALWIEPGQTRTASVNYLGPAELDASLMFVVSFRQAPVRMELRPNAEGSESGISLQYDFKTFAHIVPANALPSLRVEHVRREGEEIVVTLVNDGARFGRIDEGRIVLHAGGSRLELGADRLAADFFPAWLLPGARRDLHLAWPGIDAASDLTAEWRASPAPPR